MPLKTFNYKAYLFERNRKAKKYKRTYKVKLKAYIEYLINYVTFNLYKI